MEFEDINNKVGGCGLYHYITFFLLSVTTFKQAVNLQGLTFAVYDPKYECDIAKVKDFYDIYDENNINSYISKDQCSYTLNNGSNWIPCQKWIYDNTTLQNTLITDFNLVCSKDHYKSIFYTVFFVSELLGYFFIIISDKVGRRYILLFFLYLSIPITILQVLIYNVWVQLLLIFFSGTSSCVSVSLALTTLAEIMPAERFDIAITNYFMFYGIGYMATAAFAYIGRSWRIIYIFSLLFTVFYPFYICFVTETSRWLMLKGKRKQSYKVMTFIGKINRRVLNETDFNKWTVVENKTENICNIFQYKRMIGRCLILIITAWSFSFAYIGTSTDLTFASENIFLTTLVMGMVEIPTGPLAALIARLLSRRNGMTCLCSLGITCLLCLPFIESDSRRSIWQPWLKVILAMGGKLGFTSAWCLFDLITNEIIPTSIRSGGISIAYICVCIGSIVAPKINEISLKWHYAAPCIIYAIHLIFTVIIIWFFLPETKGLPLPQTLGEAEALEKGKELEWKIFMTNRRVDKYEQSEL